MNYGSMPIDEGNLILTDEEKEEAIKNEPQINPHFFHNIIKYHQLIKSLAVFVPSTKNPLKPNNLTYHPVLV